LKRLPATLLAAGFLIGFAATASIARTDEAESIEPKFFSNLRQVTFDFVKAGEGYFSPDQKLICFQAITPDYPFYQIYVQPLEGGVPRRVSTGAGRTTCSYFTPDGKRILFASSHLDPNLSQTEEEERQKQADDARTGRRRRYDWNFDPHMDLFTCDLQGGDLVRLTDAPGYDAEGAYSADGRLIAFCSTRHGNRDLYVMNADGSGVRQLTDAPGYNGGPFISPDGKWVIFRSDRKQVEMLQIYVIGIDGQHERALTDNVGVNWAPYWHPTAPCIIWTGADHSDPNQRPNYDLWLMKYKVDEEGLHQDGPIQRITDHEGADVLPVFSPDGLRLMWTASRTADRASQLWIADFKLPE
jgi:Tol biopolymer transport system component